jgi:hypothetical protein
LKNSYLYRGLKGFFFRESEKGFEQGKEKGREEDIKVLILDNLEKGTSGERILLKLQSLFYHRDREGRKRETTCPNYYQYFKHTKAAESQSTA